MKMQERFSRCLSPNFYEGKPEAVIMVWFVPAAERKTLGVNNRANNSRCNPGFQESIRKAFTTEVWGNILKYYVMCFADPDSTMLFIVRGEPGNVNSYIEKMNRGYDIWSKTCGTKTLLKGWDEKFRNVWSY